MTTVALHPVPRWGDVAREQVRTVGLALRRELLLLLGVLLLIATVSLTGMWGKRAERRADARVASATSLVERIVGGSEAAGGELVAFKVETGAPVRHTVPLVLIGALIPFAVWRHDPPTRRDYHTGMPVGRAAHTLTRLFAGWCWLIAAAVLCMLTLVGLDLASAELLGAERATGPIWYLVVPLTAATVAYLFVSAAMIGSDRAWLWVGGAAVLLVLLNILSASMEGPGGTTVRTVTQGHIGVSAALLGDVRVAVGPPLEFSDLRQGMATLATRPPGDLVSLEDGRMTLQPTVPSVQRWLGATALWGAIGAALVGIAMYVRRRLD